MSVFIGAVKPPRNKTRIRITYIPEQYRGRVQKLVLQQNCLLRYAEKVGDIEVVNNTQLGRLKQYDIGFEKLPY